jgi:hypothetical protein
MKANDPILHHQQRGLEVTILSIIVKSQLIPRSRELAVERKSVFRPSPNRLHCKRWVLTGREEF